jgi:hypothetical protein
VQCGTYNLDAQLRLVYVRKLVRRSAVWKCKIDGWPYPTSDATKSQAEGFFDRVSGTAETVISIQPHEIL